MTELGFSLYPERHSLEQAQTYIDLLISYGATRVFMSLLQLESDDRRTFVKYRDLVAYASQKGLCVIADVSPDFIRENAWADDLLGKAREFGLSGLRLDEALPFDDIVALTQNPYGFKIELNMSTDKQLLSDLLASSANKDNIIGCHNFYPHEWTGLSVSHFLEMSGFYHDNGIETAVFLNAQSADEGPWPLSEGLCTVEDYRHLSIAGQVALFKATGLIDNLLIANQFISEMELQALCQELERPKLTMFVSLEDGVTAVEREIVAFPHTYRGDISDYVLRSTQSRLVFRQETIPARQHSGQVRRGTVLIDNDAYGRYKGELQIALQSLKVSPKVNIVGQLTEESLLLLDYLKPWQDFDLLIYEERD